MSKRFRRLRRLRVTQECGQRWYRLSSWRKSRRVQGKWRYVPTNLWRPLNEVEYVDGKVVIVRRFGVAIGPIMILWS